MLETKLDKFSGHEAANCIMYKDDRLFLHQLKSVLYGMKSCFATERHLDAAVIKPGINNLLAHVGIFFWQHEDNFEIIVGFKECPECIIKYRSVVQQKELLWDRPSHPCSGTAGYYDRVF